MAVKITIKKTGFTLAEILITLTIIGIVSAITIPALQNSIKNAELNTAAKKAYSTLSQAYLSAVKENGTGFGGFTSNTTTSYDKFNAIKSQLKVVKECPYNSGAYGNCWASKGVGLATSPISCNQWGVNKQNSNYTIVTADGMYFMLYSYSATNGADMIAVDVNGSKGPNDWGKDVFYFIIYDTTLVPSYCSSLTHNDGTTIQTNELLAPFTN